MTNCDNMKKFFKEYWPYLTLIVFWVLVGIWVYSLFGCDRALRKENEQLREELARQQKYVPLKRDTIRDTVKVVTQQIVEVEKIKEVLTKEDKELLKDLNTKVSALESYQTLSTEAGGEVMLESHNTDPQDENKEDTMLMYKDAWVDFSYNTMNKKLQFACKDSLAIVVEKEFKKRFLWWRWGVKGYQVKAVNYNPYSTIRYSSYVKRK